MMTSTARHAAGLMLGAAAVLLLCANPTAGQGRAPHIGYAFPAGGSRGSTFEVTVGGQFLNGVRDATWSGQGVQARVLEHIIPLTAKQVLLLRDELKELTDRKRAVTASRGTTGPATTAVWTDADDQKISEITAKLAGFQRKPSSVAIAERVRVEITIAPDAEPGERELRLVTAAGLSNPLVFEVGSLPEFSETPATGDREPGSASDAPIELTLPAVANGQIMPGDVDRYRFHARKGQNLVARVSARSLIPYLADAVPGWFQATLALRDAHGQELKFADDYHFNPDPVLHCVIPNEGEYLLEIRDAIYRGREDFVYRIAVGELPFVTSAFPLGGRAGERTAVELKGWNLPAVRVVMDAAGKEPGVHSLPVRTKGPQANAIAFAVDELPECLEREPNDSRDAAQAVTLPVIVNGRIAHPGDRDIFVLEGRKDDRIVAEVTARRLGSPLDAVLELVDSSEVRIAFSDDVEDRADGLHTHHADSRLAATLPADGRYFLRLADVQNKGSSAHAYRLRISAPRPDFALRVVPSSIALRPGVSVPLTVHALRRDGFDGQIRLALRGAPEGVTLKGPALKDDSVKLTLTAPAKLRAQTVVVELEGRATIAGGEITRSAVPAEDMMQAFAYRHLVCAQELQLLIAGRWSAPRR